jgi:hypothetical protein
MKMKETVFYATMPGQTPVRLTHPQGYAVLFPSFSSYRMADFTASASVQAP